MEKNRELELENFSLGKKTVYPSDYSPKLLESFNNAHPDQRYLVKLDAYEFTSLCPKTGQPDFAQILIQYIPTIKMVESKSLKLYLLSFRNHGDFHEDCINIIADDLNNLMSPHYLEVYGMFSPRGGIAIKPFAQRQTQEYTQFAQHRMRDMMNAEGRYIK